MSTSLEQIRTLTVRGQAFGLEEVRHELERVTGAQEKVATTSERSSRRQLSAANALKRVEAQADGVTRALQKYERSMATLDRAQEQGIVSAKRYADIQKGLQTDLVVNASRAQQRMEMRALAMQRALAPKGIAAANEQLRLTNGQMLNLGRQVQDIGTMLALGASPFQILATQGAQVYDALASGPKGVRGSLQAIGTSMMALLTPTNLVIAGLTAAAGAGLYFTTRTEDEIKPLNDAMDEHAATLRRVADAYGIAAKEVEGYSSRATSLLAIRSSRAELELSARNELNEQFKPGYFNFGVLTPAIGTEGQYGQVGVADRFKAFEGPLLRLNAEMERGKGNARAFVEEVARIANLDPSNKELQRLAAELIEMAKAAADAQARVASLPEAVDDAMQALARAQSMRKAFQDAVGDLRGLTPDNRTELQRVDAAYQAALASSANPTDNRRAALAKDAALAAIAQRDAIEKAKRIAEEQVRLDEERARQQQSILTGLQERAVAYQHEAVALGMTEEAAARYREVVELTNRAKADGLGISMEERALIDQALAAYDARAAADRLRLETEKRIKAELDAQKKALEEQRKAMEDVRGIGESFIDKIIGGDLKGGLQGLLGDITKQMQEYTANGVKNTLYGTDYPTLDTVGGLGGFLGILTGQQRIQTAAAMQVNAGVVNIGGSGIGAFNQLLSGGDPWGGLRGSGGGGLAAINDNFGVSRSGDPVSAISGMLGFSENGSGRSQINGFMRANGVDIDAAYTAWCAGFVNSALKSVGVDGTGSLVANSFLNWGQGIDASSALRGDVLVKSRGLGSNQTGGHVGFATGQSRMSGAGLQLQMISGNQGDAVSKTWENAADLTVRRAVGGLDKTLNGQLVPGMSNVAGKFGQGFTSALDQVVQGVGGQGGGGGGFGGLLGGLFGGGISSRGMSIVASSGPGLYDKGGYTGPGGRHEPAGIVHRGEVVWSQNDVAAAGGVGMVEAMRLARRGYAAGGPVSGAGNRSIAGVNVNVINSAPGVEVDAVTGTDGQPALNVKMADGVVARAISKPGSRSNRQLRRMGASAPLGRY
ncbi:phage tail length tape measure family protein [Notoacmeibacter sp. MSK16QG-6]|uniref:phage tail length tape measure family protein n=1 Tax=Notoacmeibacter sp. MSK16QG-6 TaxID=2957982 RepID=UPI00209E5346|nr:phage tail length tape measure family protein [Notoacmeibacter sp. MSK16QG-6]MCP1200050.1 phage tail length tape measure family protein [Notoacmeibacter sp. MSK16QG-6]